MKDEALDNSVVTLHQKGWSIHRLSQEFGISRARVRRILKRNEQQRQGTKVEKKTVRGSKLDPYKPYIGDLLSTYINNPPTGQRIFELIKERGYTGGSTIVLGYLKKIRGSRKKPFIQCVETSPGQRASHDWSVFNVEYTQTGQKEKVIFFGYILNYSRRQYLEAVPDQCQTTLLNCLVNAFIYFEGVPHEIKSDNQKACVDRWEQGKPVFNKHYLDFATWYRFTPLAITPGKPTQNLKIERPFDYVNRSFFNSRTFWNKQDLEHQLKQWLLEINDKRIHRTTGKQPIELYGQELPYLQALPQKGFDTSISVNRIVNTEACIEYGGYFYRVSSKYIGQTCLVKVHDQLVSVYCENSRIIEHPLAQKGRKNKYVGVKQRTPKMTAVLEAKQLKERLLEIGPELEQFINEISAQKPKIYLDHLRKILSLKAHYITDDILCAVRRALSYRVFDSNAIETFLKVNAYKKNEVKLFAHKLKNTEQ